MSISVARLFRIGSALLPVCAAAPAHSQCPTHWSAPGASGQLEWNFGSPGTGTALLSASLGGAPRLVVGGEFVRAGGVEAIQVAQYDGDVFAPMPGMYNADVDGLAMFDAGSGPELYAGGQIQTAHGYTMIARWTGSTWVPVANPIPLGFKIRELHVHDDGGGAQLYVAGTFPGGLLRYDGIAWTQAGGPADQDVSSLTTFDDGAGAALYAGGRFTTIGGVSASRIARWNGSAWSPVGTGFGSGEVLALAGFDDGAGARLYAGGSFQDSGGGAPLLHIARLDSGAWTDIGGVGPGFVEALTVGDDGSGTALFAGGSFDTAGGVSAKRVARWDGQAWSALGQGCSGGYVFALDFHDDGGGAQLFAAGTLGSADARQTIGIARWNGTTWLPLGGGPGGVVRAVLEADLGAGPRVYVGGDFTNVGDLVVGHIAAWDGQAWSALGAGVDGPVHSLEFFAAGGGGPSLYVGGSFKTAGGVNRPLIARWSGSGWSTVGSTPAVAGPSDVVGALEVHDDGSGPALYVGGYFTAIGGGAKHLARWNGFTWSKLAGGLSGSSPGITDLLSFDDGYGPGLWVCGKVSGFLGAGSSGSLGLWRSSTWITFYPQLGNPVEALGVFDDGTGASIYAGGNFPVNASAAGGLARWDPAPGVWLTVGGGLETFSDKTVHALLAFDDGNGEQLYVGGSFEETTSGVQLDGLGRWDGANWSTPGGLLQGQSKGLYVRALGTSGLGGVPRLWVGGDFTSAGTVSAARLAAWTAGCDGPTSYCTAKLNSLGCTPEITSSGVSSASSPTPFTVGAIRIVSQKPGLMIYSTSGEATIPFMGGLLCLASPVVRTGGQSSGGNVPDDCSGTFAFDFNALVQSGVDPALAVGATAYAQYWYRDPLASFTVGLSDALSFPIGP